jgi:hypothetical protein
MSEDNSENLSTRATHGTPGTPHQNSDEASDTEKTPQTPGKTGETAQKTPKTVETGEQTTADRGEAGAVSKVAPESGADPEGASDSRVKPPDQETPEKRTPAPVPKRRVAQSLADLAAKEEKSLPTKREDIPDHLYSKTTKMYQAAELRVFEGITDTKIIADRVGITEKSARNVISAVRRVADEMMQRRRSAEARDAEAREPGQGVATGTGAGGDENLNTLTDSSKTPASDALP